MKPCAICWPEKHDPETHVLYQMQYPGVLIRASNNLTLMRLGKWPPKVDDAGRRNERSTE